MNAISLTLDMHQVRLDAGELMFLMQWSASRVQQFPIFSKWLALIAAAELARRQEDGLMEAAAIELPDLRGVQASCFLQASYSLSQQPLTAALASFVDDLHRKIVCDVAGFLEWQAEQQ
jgi:hypothetical protein